jgi:hypothetical protein
MYGIAEARKFQSTNILSVTNYREANLQGINTFFQRIVDADGKRGE